jgi:DNA polymerase elongation subunit (family B)
MEGRYVKPKTKVKKRNLKALVKKWWEALVPRRKELHGEKGLIPYTVADVEMKRGKVTFDLFGVADLLAFDMDCCVLIQVTSEKHRKEHLEKCQRWINSSTWGSSDERWLEVDVVNDESTKFTRYVVQPYQRPIITVEDL